MEAGLKVICDFCGRKITKFGGLLFSPPDNKGQVIKKHLCKECYSDIANSKAKKIRNGKTGKDYILRTVGKPIRVDRPELRKKARELAVEIYEFAEWNKGRGGVVSKEYFNRKADQIHELYILSGYPKFEKLDRPDREKIARAICCFAENNKNCAECKHNTPTSPFPDCFSDIREDTDKLLALIPDIEEAIIQARKEQMVIDWAQAGKDVEEAKKQGFEDGRHSFLATTVVDGMGTPESNARLLGMNDIRQLPMWHNSWSHDWQVPISAQDVISFEAGEKQERERILTDDISLDVFHRMELWWYEPENMEMIEDLCAGEFDEVSKLLRSFITTLRQALKEEK